MQTDPPGDPQGGYDQGAGATGTPPPGPDEALKRENAELREKNRQLQAQALGATHGLTPTQIELLAGQDLDKQATFASKLAEEAKATQPAQPAPTPTPAPTGEPPAQPAAQPQQPTPVPDPAAQAAQDAMAAGGAAPYPGVAPTGAGGGESYDQKVARIAAENPPHVAWEKLGALQSEELAKAREEQAP